MKPSRFLPLAALGLAAALASTPGGPGGRAVAQDAELDRLQLQLRDCAGPSCVPQRNQLIAHLRQRTRDCTGDACEPLRTRLHDQQQLRACDAAGDECAALRRQVRERERQMERMHGQDGPGRGGGMDGGGMGGRN